jgi:sugar phosphate isomerase/epimerase
MDFPALLSTLKAGDFSGIIKIEVPENKGAIFVDSGEKGRIH